MPLYLHVCASLPLRPCSALLDLRWDCQALFNQLNRLFESFEAVHRADMYRLSRFKNFHFGFMLYIKYYDWWEWCLSHGVPCVWGPYVCTLEYSYALLACESVLRLLLRQMTLLLLISCIFPLTVILFSSTEHCYFQPKQNS